MNERKTIKLPEDHDKLIGCYMLVSLYLRNLWTEYVTYAESNHCNRASRIFEIIFHEMDFYDHLREEIMSKLPIEISATLRNLDDFSDW